MADPFITTGTPQPIDAPQTVREDESSICTTGHTPLVLTGAMLWILRRHFSEPGYIKADNLRQYTWNQSTERTGITIESFSRWYGQPSQRVQARPGLYIRRNEYRTSRLGISQLYMTGTYPERQTVGDSNYAIDTDPHHGILIVGSHTVFCTARRAAEAEALGAEVYYELLEFSPVIYRDLDLYRFQVADMGALSRVEESEEHWTVPVTTVWAFKHDWVLRKREVLLKSASLSVE